MITGDLCTICHVPRGVMHASWCPRATSSVADVLNLPPQHVAGVVRKLEAPTPPTLPVPAASLPDDASKRNEYPMADGLLDYFPNALAEVAKLSHLATQQHHPDKGMHWDRSKSTDHRNKIMRHLVDTHTVDDKGIDHWAMVCWRALAGYQTYLEEKHGLPPSRASRNLPLAA